MICFCDREFRIGTTVADPLSLLNQDAIREKKLFPLLMLVEAVSSGDEGISGLES